MPGEDVRLFDSFASAYDLRDTPAPSHPARDVIVVMQLCPQYDTLLEKWFIWMSVRL